MSRKIREMKFKIIVLVVMFLLQSASAVAKSAEARLSTSETSYSNFISVVSNIFTGDSRQLYVGGSTMVPAIQGNVLSLSKAVDVGKDINLGGAKHIMGPGRLFRRIDNSPYSTRVRRDPKRTEAMSGKSKITLSAVLPGNISVSDSQVTWRVVPLNGGGKTISRKGKNVAIHLKPGKKYKATLKIGTYKTSKTFSTQVSRNNKHLVKVEAKVGVLYATSNYAKKPVSDTLNWQVVSGGRSVSKNSGRMIKAILPVGSYKVNAKLGKVTKSQTVAISSGKTSKITLKLPSAMVKLSAYDGNNQVLDKSMTYELYYKPHGRMKKRIFRQQKNSTRDTVPPGLYEATLNVRNKRLVKTFFAGEGAVEHIKFNLK